MQVIGRYYLDKNKVLSELEFAIRRLNITYSRETPEDQLIDLVIALESALLPTQKDEISYRLSLRAAVLLGGSDIGRTVQIIKSAYAVRSKVVHSGTPYQQCIAKQVDKLKPYNIESYNFIAELREVTRSVIVRLIECIHAESVKISNASKSKFLKQVCDTLDEQIIKDIQLAH